MESGVRARLILGVAIAIAVAVAVTGLAGCGRPGAGGGAGPAAEPEAVADLTELSWEGQALEAMGFSPVELTPVAAVADPSSRPSVNPDRPARHHKRLRFWFHRRVLHGEAVVQTDQGTKTVVAQRGTVTAIDATSVTVRSTDGFTLTWTFGDPLRVVERRTQVQPSAITVGRQIGVAGEKSGDTTLARLIVLPITR